MTTSFDLLNKDWQRGSWLWWSLYTHCFLDIWVTLDIFLITRYQVQQWSNWLTYFKRWSLPCTLQWRHTERDGVSYHQYHDCLLYSLFKAHIKETAKLRVTGPCEGNSPVTGEFPAQRASNAENVSIWWRHHDIRYQEFGSKPSRGAVFSENLTYVFFFRFTGFWGFCDTLMDWWYQPK